MKIQAIRFMKLLILVIALISSPVLGQSHDDAGHEVHEFKRFRVAINLAHAYMPQATADIDGILIIPVYGFDFQFRITPKWALGLKNDIEIAQYILPETDESGEAHFRENPFILSMPVYYTPKGKGLTFFTGPGIELEDHHNFWVWRLGLGYEIELPGHWDFAPELVYDLKDGAYNSFTIALAVGKKF
jgi:hypothetical protein